MNYCVIAVRDNFQFRSVFCRSKEDLLTTLQDEHQGLERAKYLVGQGDICQLNRNGVRYYAKDWGFNWKTTQPTEFASPKALFDYVRATGIARVYLFEHNEWRCLESEIHAQNRDREVA